MRGYAVRSVVVVPCSSVVRSPEFTVFYLMFSTQILYCLPGEELGSEQSLDVPKTTDLLHGKLLFWSLYNELCHLLLDPINNKTPQSKPFHLFPSS